MKEVLFIAWVARGPKKALPWASNTPIQIPPFLLSSLGPFGQQY